MAAGTSLVIQYETESGGSTTHTWKYAKTNASLANVKAFISATIANGAIFTAVPVAAKSAKLVTTTESTYDLDQVMASHGANDPDMRGMISRTPVDEDENTDGERVEVTESLYDRGQDTKIAALEAELKRLKGQKA